MNDIRRTILWVIFGFSMVLLWDQWQVYNGHAATFFSRAGRHRPFDARHLGVRRAELPPKLTTAMSSSAARAMTPKPKLFMA